MSRPEGTPILPSRRVHRVAHRIGTVIGVPLLIAAVLCLGSAAVRWVSPPVAAAKFEDVNFYGSHPTLQGENVVFSDGSFQTLASALEAENGIRMSRHEIDVSDRLTFSAVFAFGAAVAYAILRSIGWIVAGAFRD